MGTSIGEANAVYNLWVGLPQSLTMSDEGWAL